MKAQPSGFNYHKSVEIQASAVSGTSDLINFPMLFSVTNDNDLRHVSQGGHVQHMDGFDIVFTLSDCYTILEHEIESYDPVTGTIIAWVKIPGLSATANTTIRMYYGNNLIDTSPSSAGVWGVDYEHVYHMTDDPTTGLAAESTINRRSASLLGSWNSADSVAGQIGASLQFDGNSEMDQMTANTYEEADNTVTWSAWVRLETGSPDYAGLFYDYGGINFDNAHNRGIDNEVRFAANAFWQVQTGLAVQENAWSYVALSMNGNVNNETILYVGNGGTLQSYNYNSTFTPGFASILRIGNQPCCGDARFFIGRIDEVRFASVTLSSDWITTEYNNQYDPTSFYTIGVEVAGGGTGCGSPDVTEPTPTISSEISTTNSTTFSLNVAFTEPVQGFDVGDFMVTNGTASNLQGGGAYFTVDITATAEGLVNVQIPAAMVTDLFGNANVSSSVFQMDYDVTGATATITTSASDPTNLDQIPISIVFDEPVRDFSNTSNDLFVTNFWTTMNFQTLDEVDGFATTFTLELAPGFDAEGILVVLEDNRSFDQAGNATNRTEFFIESDRTAPTVGTITSTESNGTTASAIPISLTFSEGVIGMTASDITVTNGSVSNFMSIGADGHTFSATISPQGGGATTTVDILGGVATDTAGNNNTAATQFAIVSNRSTFSSVANGDFNVSATWGGVGPGTGAGVIIEANHTVTLQQNETIGSVVAIENGATLDLNGFTLTLNDGGISIPGTGQLQTNGGTIAYAPSTSGFVIPHDVTYDDLNIRGTGTTTLSGNLTVNGNLQIESGAMLDLGGAFYQIDLNGNWINHGTFVEGFSTVIFSSATSNQSIDVTETFFNLQVNNSTTAGTVQLNADVQVTNALTLTNGDLRLGNQDLILSSGASITGGGNSSYIQAEGSGHLRQLLTPADLMTTFDFPVGDVDDYSPFSFQPNSGTFGANAAVALQVVDNAHSQVETSDVYTTRYWVFEDTDITAINYDVSYIYTDSDIAGGAESNLIAMKFAAFQSGSATDVGTNTLSFNGLTSFSEFTGGNGSTNDPTLPVEWLDFSGKEVERDVLLTWSTAQEINNDFFEIERASVNNPFSVIGTIDGQGTTKVQSNYQFIDRAPMPGVNYYRIKQIDYDGQFDHSAIISVDWSFRPGYSLRIYPNPTFGSISVHMEATGTYQVISMSGQMVKKGRLGVGDQLIDLDQVTPGVYLMRIDTPSGILVEKLTVQYSK